MNVKDFSENVNNLFSLCSRVLIKSEDSIELETNFTIFKNQLNNIQVDRIITFFYDVFSANKIKILECDDDSWLISDKTNINIKYKEYMFNITDIYRQTRILSNLNKEDTELVNYPRYFRLYLFKVFLSTILDQKTKNNLQKKIQKLESSLGIKSGGTEININGMIAGLTEMLLQNAPEDKKRMMKKQINDITGKINIGAAIKSYTDGDASGLSNLMSNVAKAGQNMDKEMEDETPSSSASPSTSLVPSSSSVKQDAATPAKSS